MYCCKNQKADLKFKHRYTVYRTERGIKGLTIGWSQLKFSWLLQKKWLQSSSVEKVHKCCTHTLPNVNAKVSMDVCISPNIAFVFSGFTSLKLMPVESDKIQELQPK